MWAAPKHAPALIKPLLAAGNDKEPTVREAAREALVKVVQAAPALAAPVREALLAAGKD